MRKFKTFLSELEWVPEDKLLPQELEFHNDCKVLTILHDDLRKLSDKFDIECNIEFRKSDMPVYVERHPVLKAKWQEIHNDIVTHMIEFRHVS